MNVREAIEMLKVMPQDAPFYGWNGTEWTDNSTILRWADGVIISAS